MAGTISSLGMGSGILTQDVLDQLRKVDEASFIQPLESKISLAANKARAIGEIDGWMKALADAAYDLQSMALYTERSATVTGSGVSVTAAANTDLQSFSLGVVSLAKKEIVESGSFASTTDLIASGPGSLNLNIGGVDYAINYDATTTLEDLKNTINTVAGGKVGASIVQLATGDFRLFLTSKDTGIGQAMTLTDTTGGLTGTQLTTGMSTIQSGSDAVFTFNGVTVTRPSNVISDLVTGATITLEQEGGSANVNITQNTDVILEKLNTFVEKYNAAAGGIAKMTHNSAVKIESGIFSSDSTIKSMLQDLKQMMTGLGGGLSIIDYGLELDKSGVLSLDKAVFNTQMAANASNVQAFFAGGTYLNADMTTTTLTGFFTGFKSGVETYTKFNGLIDSYESAITESKTKWEEDKEKAIARLDKRYETMAKQFAAYDAIISRISQQSSFLTQMINSANATQNS